MNFFVYPCIALLPIFLMALCMLCYLQLESLQLVYMTSKDSDQPGFSDPRIILSRQQIIFTLANVFPSMNSYRATV